MIINTELYVNGGNWWGMGAFGFFILAIAGAITWGTSDNKVVGRSVGIPILTFAILASAFSLSAAITTHDTEYASTVQQIRDAGFSDPIDINEQTFTSGERWCALKPIGTDQTTVFKIVCEDEK